MPLVKYEHASLAILRVHALFYLPDVVFIALLFFVIQLVVLSVVAPLRPL